MNNKNQLLLFLTLRFADRAGVPGWGLAPRQSFALHPTPPAPGLSQCGPPALKFLGGKRKMGRDGDTQSKEEDEEE